MIGKPAAAALISLTVALSGVAAGSASAQDAQPPLRQVGTIDLPGPKGRRFDYLTVDPGRGWLFSAHLAAGQTYIIDLKTQQVVATVEGTPGVEGLEFAPDLDKVYASNAGDDTVAVIDLASREVVARIPTLAKPDGLTYAAPFHRIFVSNEEASAVSVIDTEKDESLGAFTFRSSTGVPAYDPVSKLVWVNLQDLDTLAALDPATNTLAGTYDVEGCVGNHGMALDGEHRRAFLACQGNSVLVVFDLDAHKVIQSIPIARGSDVVKFDPGLGRIYVACYAGAISVIQEETPDRYTKLGDVPVEQKVHSLAVDPATHRVYAPAEEIGGEPAANMLVFEPAPAR